ncbi:hypothetical protein AMK59_3310 [Oryctes borbonicus]|uniref:Uncharacterized protein n=1 Tax=Oryctes borbonicus TaxID=1629725 RepID=A0A0T6B7Y5_9SCAR|nr:hypothetical protein AMK59_3310 [Oryctes borbonicus]
MNTHEKIKEWANTLGYQGAISDSLIRISNNPLTSVIWCQLLSQVKPKQESRKIKRGNLIARFEAKDTSFLNKSFGYPIKELDLWEKKCKLQQDIEDIKEYINDKENVSKKFSNEHKIIAIKRRNIKDKIKENETRAFLLIKKSEAFKKEIAEVEENITFFRNLTPVEASETEPDVGDRLRKCVEKIESSLVKEEIGAPACPKNNLFQTPQKSALSSIFVTSDSSVEYHSQCVEFKKEIVSDVQCLEDKELLKDLQAILYNNDSQSILNVIVNDVDILKTKLLNVITTKAVLEKIPEKDDEVDSVMEVQAKQIENELYSLKYSKEIRRLKSSIKSREKSIDACLKKMDIEPSRILEIRELHLLQRKQICLEAFCDCTKRLIIDGRLVKDARRQLRDINANIAKLQDKWVDKLRNINYKFELYKKMYKTMLFYREETKMIVKKLSQFTTDLNWTLPLTHNLHSKEIEIFMEFPLEYNRRINTSDGPLYIRDIMRDVSVDVEKINSNTLHTLLLLIDCPYSAPETLFYSLWEKKMKLHIQKSLQKTVKVFDCKTYTLDELEKRESFVNYAIEKFSELKRKDSTKSGNEDVSTIRELSRLWLEYPFVDYVSENRFYEGKNVKHYQNVYNKLFDLLNKE